MNWHFVVAITAVLSGTVCAESSRICAQEVRPRSVFPAHDEVVRAIAFAPDGKTLATVGGGDEDDSIRIWDAVTCRRKHVLKEKSPIFHLAFSPDGKILAFPLWRGPVCLRETANWEKR